MVEKCTIMAEKNPNIENSINAARVGVDMDSSISQLQKGKLSYALNAIVESFDNSAVSYQNELGNIGCLNFPEGYKYVGGHYIQERKKHIFFLTKHLTLRQLHSYFNKRLLFKV